jgi:mevalonate pyrophosphate decarboxylase
MSASDAAGAAALTGATIVDSTSISANKAEKSLRFISTSSLKSVIPEILEILL